MKNINLSHALLIKGLLKSTIIMVNEYCYYGRNEIHSKMSTSVLHFTYMYICMLFVSIYIYNDKPRCRSVNYCTACSSVRVLAELLQILLQCALYMYICTVLDFQK